MLNHLFTNFLTLEYFYEKSFTILNLNKSDFNYKIIMNYFSEKNFLDFNTLISEKDNSKRDLFKNSGKEAKLKYDPKSISFQFREPNRKVKELIWTEIDNYLAIERENLDKELNCLEEKIKFNLLIKRVMMHLNKTNLISKDLNFRSKLLIERSIVMIYLLRSQNPRSDRQIALKAGYSQRASIIKKIKIHLGILEKNASMHLWKEIDDYIVQKKEDIYSKLKFLEENEKYHLLKQIIMNYLIDETNLVDRNLSPTKKTSIERTILVIYLLRSNSPLTFAKIMIKSGYKDTKQIQNIANYFGIYAHLEIDYISQTRVCAKCKRMLSFDKFDAYNGKIRSMCRECDNIRDGINRFQKKLLATIFMVLKYGKSMRVEEFLQRVDLDEKFDVDVKCPGCGLDLHFLPAIDFHHPNPALKTISWKKLAPKKIEEIITILDREQCVLLCGNCHRLKNATFIMKHLDEVLTENIDWKQYNDNERKNLRRSIRKKKIFEDLYSGVCFYCKKVDLDKLAVIDFHHTNKKLKKHTWSRELRDIIDIELVKNILLKEKQVGSCHNCHYMETAFHFENNKYEILSKYLSGKILKKLSV